MSFQEFQESINYETINNSLIKSNPESFIRATRNKFWGKRLLLVEDMILNREIVTSLLSETGLSIDEAENGLEAYTIIKSYPNRYDLVFMDIQMPKMDGLEATRKIRSIPADGAQNLPIIAMTANINDDDISECRAAGMNDHLGKPLDMDAVLVIMTKYLG